MYSFLITETPQILPNLIMHIIYIHNTYIFFVRNQPTKEVVDTYSHETLSYLDAGMSFRFGRTSLGLHFFIAHLVDLRFAQLCHFIRIVLTSKYFAQKRAV